jgi:hypothetical protein
MVGIVYDLIRFLFYTAKQFIAYMRQFVNIDVKNLGFCALQFVAMKDFNTITPETMLLLWSMRERYNPSSKFRTYFEALPAKFNTGRCNCLYSVKLYVVQSSQSFIESFYCMYLQA